MGSLASIARSEEVATEEAVVTKLYHARTFCVS